MMKYSELRSQTRVSLAESAPLRLPFTIFIEPTNICNFQCTYCPESFDNFYELSGGKFKLSPDDFNLIAAQIESLGEALKVINFYMMGEPLANRETPRFIAESKRRGLAKRLILTTNASLLDERASRSLLEAGLDHLRVSIYGANQEQFTKVTGSTLSLQRIRDKVARFRELRDANNDFRTNIYVKMIDPLDQTMREAFLELFNGVADEVRIEPVMNWNDDFDGSLAILSSDALMNSEYFARKKCCCPSPFYTAIIHSDLNVSVCCVDWNKKLVIGNLRDNSLKDIWSGDKLLAIQLAHLRGQRDQLPGCASCTSYPHISR